MIIWIYFLRFLLEFSNYQINDVKMEVWWSLIWIYFPPFLLEFSNYLFQINDVKMELWFDRDDF